MKLVTRSEFSRLAGVSRQAIAKAIKNNRLDIIGDGPTAKINTQCYKSIQYIKISNVQRDTTVVKPLIQKLIKAKPSKRGRASSKPAADKTTAGKARATPAKKPPKKPATKPPKKSTEKKKITIHLPAPEKPQGKKKKRKKINEPIEEITKELAVEDIPKKELKELLNLSARYEKARTGKIEEQEQKLKLENARIRGELVDREKVYNHLFLYLDKLHSNLERLADSYLSDILPLAIDAGKISPEHRNVWHDEVLSQIDETKNGIVKMLKKIEKEQAK